MHVDCRLICWGPLFKGKGLTDSPNASLFQVEKKSKTVIRFEHACNCRRSTVLFDPVSFLWLARCRRALLVRLPAVAAAEEEEDTARRRLARSRARR
jgi:hypothetical protein